MCLGIVVVFIVYVLMGAALTTWFGLGAEATATILFIGTVVLVVVFLAVNKLRS